MKDYDSIRAVGQGGAEDDTAVEEGLDGRGASVEDSPGAESGGPMTPGAARSGASAASQAGELPKSHFFAYMSRMRFIQRWALMRNTAPENVQEHSHQAAVLAHALAVVRNEKFGGHADPGAVAAAALYHDASEILTGDMPTPIKYDNPAIQRAYKEVEAVAERKLLELLPEELQKWYAPLLTEADPETERLVKAADKLSAHIKCLEELKAGNAEFREAAAQTRRALEAMELPEVDYFLEVFLDSFSLTLDELK